MLLRPFLVRALPPVLLAGALSLATASAQDVKPAAKPVTAPASATAAKAPPVPLLWKVSDADNAIYVLGSFHLLKSDDYPLSPDIDAAFAAADKLVFEVPPEQMNDPGAAPKFLAAAGYSDGRKLSQVLPGELHEKLSRLMGKQGVPVSALDNYEPWFVNLSLFLGVAQAMGFSPQQGLDLHLMKRAAEAGKPTGGLETMDAQLAVLDGSPMAEQVAGLDDFLSRPEQMPGMVADMHNAWRDGDTAKLDALTGAEMRTKAPQTYRIVNVERNDAWLPQLQKMLDQSKRGDDTLVVVGALHLLGNDGLVEKLRAKGYKIERLCSACAPGTADVMPAAPAPAQPAATGSAAR
ncbi:TraB/GumN family protein [Lysobacter silvisoli]|nr:TraB/GumN family protein [Lysobacter silvisoli]